MVSKFIALPVTQGDSFFLELDSKVILFDGGRYPQFIAQQFRQLTTKNRIDYLICSHNDADHAEGIIGLFDTGITVEEVWLPGSWGDIISQIHSERDQLVNLLLDEVFDENCKEQDLESLAQKIQSKIEYFDKNDETVTEEQIEAKIDELCEMDGLFRYPIWTRLSPYLFGDAIEAAYRIITIAKLAYAHGAKIRWFDHDEFKHTKNTRGGNRYLKPLNSVEIRAFKKRNLKLLYKLALSVSNKKSLAFISDYNNYPVVVFTADSDLDSVHLSLTTATRNVLITAPHHGSDANKDVYTMFLNHPCLWVRSDMRSKKRPCYDYKQLKNKYCTYCKNSFGTRRAIEFNVSGNYWITLNIACSCK